MTAMTAARTVTGTYIDALPVRSLMIDPTYQRELDEARVSTMADAFDRTLLGVLEVSKRADGRYAILDGQHRWVGVQRACGDDAYVVCNVHQGLSTADEARLFHEIDTKRRGHTWWDRWRARRGMAESTVLAIDQALNRHGLQVNPAPAEGNIRATKAVETIVNDLGGLDVLDHVLVLLTGAFGRGFDAFDAGLLQGLALVLTHYDDELDEARLVEQLSSITPRQLRARAAALRESRSGTIPRLTAAVIIDRYNARRTGRRLEPFLTRVPTASKAGPAWNQDRKERNKIRRWAKEHGHDLGEARNIPPSVRRAYHASQANPNAEPAIPPTRQPKPRTGHDLFDEDASPEIGIPDRAGVLRAYAHGRTVRFVMDTWGLDYATARALWHEHRANRAA